MFRSKLFRLVSIPVLAAFLFACQADVNEVTGPSFNGNSVGVTAIAGDSGLPSDGVSQATIRVEVFDINNEVVDAAAVSLTTTLGTLGAASVTTVSGVATTTLTSATTEGTAFVTATFENVTATTSVAFVNFQAIAGA